MYLQYRILDLKCSPVEPIFASAASSIAYGGQSLESKGFALLTLWNMKTWKPLVSKGTKLLSFSHLWACNVVLLMFSFHNDLFGFLVDLPTARGGSTSDNIYLL